MFRDDRAELAHTHVERFTGTIIEAEDQSVLPAIRSRDIVVRMVMRGTSGACSRKWIRGRSFYGGSGLTEEREKVSELLIGRTDVHGSTIEVSVFSHCCALRHYTGLVQGQ